MQLLVIQASSYGIWWLAGREGLINALLAISLLGAGLFLELTSNVFSDF